jgi:hypothetical protein
MVLSGLMFWKKEQGPRPLTQQVQLIVTSRLQMTKEQTNGLLMVEKPGLYSGRTVKHFRAFNPEAVASVPGGVQSVRYGTLDSHKSAIVFEGHIEQNGSVVVYDRRSAAAAAR